MTDTKKLSSILENTKPLIPHDTIRSRVSRLREVLEQRIKTIGLPTIVLVLGKGGHMFAQHLLLDTQFQDEVHYMYTSTYGSDNDVKEFKVNFTTVESFKRKFVIVLDDIYDTGTTQKNVRDLCMREGALGFEALVLLRKPDRHVHEIELVGVGFEIPDVFVYGWGMDAYGFDTLRRVRHVSCIIENLPDGIPYRFGS